MGHLKGLGRIWCGLSQTGHQLTSPLHSQPSPCVFNIPGSLVLICEHSASVLSIPFSSAVTKLQPNLVLTDLLVLDIFCPCIPLILLW